MCGLGRERLQEGQSGQLHHETRSLVAERLDRDHEAMCVRERVDGRLVRGHADVVRLLDLHHGPAQSRVRDHVAHPRASQACPLAEGPHHHQVAVLTDQLQRLRREACEKVEWL